MVSASTAVFVTETRGKTKSCLLFTVRIAAGLSAVKRMEHLSRKAHGASWIRRVYLVFGQVPSFI
jgi:hypothetical protein